MGFRSVDRSERRNCSSLARTRERGRLTVLASGQSRVGCVASVVEPPFTNDRSPAALGRLFAGMAGSLGGVTIKADGSNINPSAIALANLKLADGSFVIPIPQTIDESKPLVHQGFSVFSDPCHFNQNQFLATMEYLPSATVKYDGRFFISPDNQAVTFPGNGLNPIRQRAGLFKSEQQRFRSRFHCPAQTHLPTDPSMRDDLDMSEQQRLRGQRVRSIGRTLVSQKER